MKSSTVLTGLRVSLDAINTLVSGLNLPFLSVVPSVMSKIITAAEAARENQEACIEMASKATELIVAMVDATKGKEIHHIDRELERDMKDLHRTLQSINDFITSMCSRNRIVKMFKTSSDVKRVDELKAQLDQALRVFDVKDRISGRISRQVLSEKLDLVLDKLGQTERSNSLQSLSSSFTLYNSEPPPTPEIIFGRTEYVNNAVNLILQRSNSNSTTNTGARLAILGPGGIGKTTVATAIINHPDIIQSFTKSRFFISCDAITTPDAFLGVLLNALGAPDSTTSSTSGASEDPLSRLIAHLNAPFHGFVVIDNFETLWDTEETRVQTQNLLNRLTAVRTLTLLITMRGNIRPGGIRWTQPHLEPLEVLSLESARQTYLAISPLSQHDSHSSLPALDELLKAVDCLPLAVTLMAYVAQTGATPSQLFTQWKQERTKVLSTGGFTPQESLGVSISLSVTSPLMQRNPSALELLRLICLFPKGINDSNLKSLTEGTSSLSSDYRTATVILTRVGLVSKGNDQFWKSLSPIRFYVLEHHPITPSQFETVKSFYLDLAFQAKGADFANGRALILKTALEKEHDNMEEVLKLCLQATPRGGVADSRVMHAILYFHHYVIWSKKYTYHLLEKAIQLLRPQDAQLSSQYFQCLARIKKELNDYNGAKSAFGRAFELYSQLGDLQSQGDCLQAFADVCFFQGNIAESQQYLTHAVSIFQTLGQLNGLGNCYQSLGDIAIAEAKYEDAATYLNYSRTAFERAGEKFGEANAMSRLANVEMLQMKYAQAEKLSLAASQIFTQLDYPSGRAMCYQALGEISKAQSSNQVATEYFQNAIKLFDIGQNKLGKAQSLRSLGDIAMAQDDFPRAKSIFSDALRQFEEVNNLWGIAQCQKGIGDCHRITGDSPSAIAELTRAKETFTSLNDKLSVAQCLQSLGDIQKMCGNYPAAKEVFVSARGEFESIQYKLGVLHCLKMIGDLDSLMFQYEESNQQLWLAREGSLGINDKVGAAQCLNSIGDNLIAIGNTVQATHEHTQAMHEFGSIQNRSGVAECQRSLGVIFALEGRLSEAENTFMGAKAVFDEIGQEFGSALCVFFIGNVHRMCGQAGRAQQEMAEAKRVFEKLDTVKIVGDYVRGFGEMGVGAF